MQSLTTVLCGVLTVLALAECAAKGRSKHLIALGEGNWQDMLVGEWMIEFHAPWCPACKDLQKTWNSFADWSKDLAIGVAEVDVTVHPGLSGRFLVTALPTIYHVKDGVFRHYSGVRDKEEFMQFIEQKKWTVIEPISKWKHPGTPQMSVVAMFFRLSMKVRDLHNHLMEKQGLPAWASYAIFGGATLVLGCILGFMIVMLIDFVFPATAGVATSKDGGKKDKKKADKKKAAADEAERKKAEEAKAEGSQANSSQSEGEADSADESAEVRQRKSEKKVANGNKPQQQPGTPEGKKKK